MTFPSFSVGFSFAQQRSRISSILNINVESSKNRMPSLPVDLLFVSVLSISSCISSCKMFAAIVRLF